jgi:hypothetical protein
MTNIRFPLKLPTSGHPNPYTIDFDFLPYPLTLPNPETNEARLYTSIITINDTNSESSKIIEHIYPNGKVFFVIDDSHSNINELVDNIMNSNFIGVISGMWIHLGTPEDIINTKQTLINSSFIPTAVVYNNISINENTLIQIKQKISNQLVVNPSLDTPMPINSINEILKEWLTGNIGLFINESDIVEGNINLPSVNNNFLQVGAIMADGNGIEFDTIHKLIAVLRRNRSVNNMFSSLNSFAMSDTPNDIGIIPCPLFNFIEKTSTNLLHISHRNHPLRVVYPIDPTVLEACIFFKNIPSRLKGNIEKLPFRHSYRVFKVELDGVIRDLHPSGLFFARDLLGRTIQLTKNGVPQIISLLSPTNTLVGLNLIINQESKIKNHYRIAIDNIKPEDISISGNEYLDIEPNFNNLLNFLNQLSIRINITLTNAECFARALGFIEMSTINYFRNANHKIRRNDLEYAIIPGNATIIYFLSISWAVLTDDSIRLPKAEAEFLNDNFEEYFSELPNNLKPIITDVIMKRPFWTRNHGDGSNDGWKHFGEQPDSGGRHDHFLTNAFAYYDTNIPYFDRVATLHAFMFYEEIFDDDKIDGKYNEKGREFADWLSFNYIPGEVYSKIKELVVEKSNFQ